MSKWYIGTDTGSKALAHYAKGASAKDHKWVSRSLKNGHWVYVYDGDGSKSGGTDSDSGESNLDRVKKQTEQRKSMNAQAENERNKARDAHNTIDRIDRLARDAYEKQRSEFAESSAAIGIDPDDIVYDTDMANRIRAIEAQKRYGKIIGDAKRREKWDEDHAANMQRVNLEKLIIQYQKAGYKLAGKHSGTIYNPDERVIMTNPKTGKNVQLPTPRELAKSAQKQEEILRKNEIGPYKTIGTLAKERADANNKANAAYAQQRYAELTKSLPKQQTTPSAKSHEVNSNGFKARPATAADADLFKNKSSAETKNKVTISDHGGNTGIKTEVTKKKKKRL